MTEGIDSFFKQLLEDELFRRGILSKIETSEMRPMLIPPPENVSVVEYKDSLENKAIKQLPHEDYKRLLKEDDYKNKPLPQEYYKNYKEGGYFGQVHIRGITPEEYKDYKNGKIPLWRTFIDHSLHVDWRADFAGDKLMQFVITEDSVDSYLRVLRGDRDPDTGNVAKGLVIIKPSAEPELKKEEKDRLILHETDAKKIGDLIIESKSYWIEPGDVGTTAYTYAYLGTMVTGESKAGVMRPDFKETFCEPASNLPDKNKELFNGRWIWKAFEKPRHLWWVFKAVANPEPANPWCECDQGNYNVIPAERLTKFKKEEYPEWTNRKEYC